MALFKRTGSGKPGEWYYCVKHGKVEEGPECPAKNRLGPYPTQAEASRALETVQRKNEAWDNDPRWGDAPRRDGDADGDGGGDGGKGERA